MKNFSNIMLTLALLGMPTMTIAQSGIRKSFNDLTQSVRGKETHCTQKDDDGQMLLSQTDIYTITVTGNDKALLLKAIDALRTDTMKAYSKLSADKGQMPLQFLGKGDMNIKVGTRYDHYLCNLFDDKSRKGYRYAYAIEWNDEKLGVIEARVVSLYDKKPTRIEGTSLAKFKMVLNTLDLDDSLTISNRALNEVIESVDGGAKPHKDIKMSEASQWMADITHLFISLERPKLNADDIIKVAQIYTLCKGRPAKLDKSQNEYAVYKLSELKDKAKSEPLLIDILDASIKCFK